MQAAEDAVAAAVVAVAVDVQHLIGLKAGELQEPGLQPLLALLQVGEQV